MSTAESLPGNEPPAEHPGRWPHARAIGWCLVALVVAWFVVVLWSAPQESNIRSLEKDVASQQITGWWPGDIEDDDAGSQLTNRETTAQVTVGSGGVDQPSQRLLWQTGNGRTHWIPVGSLNSHFDDVQPPEVAPGQYDTSESAIDAVLLLAFEKEAGPPSDPSTAPRGLANALGWAVSLSVLALALMRRPRSGTRWFWLWMSGLPLGLGVFWYLFRELGPNASLEPAQQRTRGWVGLVFNFLVTSVAQSVVALTT